jgi:predicted transcriptional regulator
MVRYSEKSMHRNGKATAAVLGPLEISVMETMWTRGKSTVRDVAAALGRGLAYTTVMTTLDRLYKKGMLERGVSERAYSYWPRWSREEWDQKRAGDLVNGFLAGPSRRLLISCLVDAVGEKDLALLDEMEQKIQLRRREMEAKEMEAKNRP